MKEEERSVAKALLVNLGTPLTAKVEM